MQTISDHTELSTPNATTFFLNSFIDRVQVWDGLGRYTCRPYKEIMSVCLSKKVTALQDSNFQQLPFEW